MINRGYRSADGEVVGRGTDLTVEAEERGSGHFRIDAEVDRGAWSARAMFLALTYPRRPGAARPGGTHGGMDPSIYPWVRIAHIIGIVLWVGGLLAVLALLRVHTQVDGVARESLTRVEKATAMVMDLGATLAIAAGLYLAFRSPKFFPVPGTAFSSGGWFHIKLTLVVLGPFALHGLARAKIKKFARGQLKPLPLWVVPVLILAVIGIVVMAVHPTLLRK